jgi:hypothetical protein
MCRPIGWGSYAVVEGIFGRCSGPRQKGRGASRMLEHLSAGRAEKVELMIGIDHFGEITLCLLLAA